MRKDMLRIAYDFSACVTLRNKETEMTHFCSGSLKFNDILHNGHSKTQSSLTSDLTPMI